MVELKAYICNGCSLTLGNMSQSYVGVHQNAYILEYNVIYPENNERSIIITPNKGVLHLCEDCYKNKFETLIVD